MAAYSLVLAGTGLAVLAYLQGLLLLTVAHGKFKKHKVLADMGSRHGGHR